MDDGSDGYLQCNKEIIEDLEKPEAAIKNITLNGKVLVDYPIQQNEDNCRWYQFPYKKSNYLIGDKIFVNLKSLQLDGRAIVKKDARDSTYNETEKRICSRHTSNIGSLDSLNSNTPHVTKETSQVDVARGNIQIEFLVYDKQFKYGLQNIDEKRIITVRERRREGRTPIFLTNTTEEYRKCSIAQLEKTDITLEIGCSTGKCTKMLHNRTTKLIAVDVSCDHLQRAKAYVFSDEKHNMGTHAESDSAKNNKTGNLKNPKGVDTEIFDNQNNSNTTVELDSNTSFHYFDMFCSDFSQLPIPASSITLVLIDIGGDRNAKQVLEAIEWVLGKLKNVECVIVKSKNLSELKNMHEGRGNEVKEKKEKAVKKLKQEEMSVGNENNYQQKPTGFIAQQQTDLNTVQGGVKVRSIIDNPLWDVEQSINPYQEVSASGNQSKFLTGTNWFLDFETIVPSWSKSDVQLKKLRRLRKNRA